MLCNGWRDEMGRVEVEAEGAEMGSQSYLLNTGLVEGEFISLLHTNSTIYGSSVGRKIQ